MDYILDMATDPMWGEPALDSKFCPGELEKIKLERERAEEAKRQEEARKELSATKLVYPIPTIK